MDWDAIRNEYIMTQISQRDLAAKWGVSYRTLSKRSINEGWVDLRCQACKDRVAKSVEKIAEQQADVDSQVHDAALELLTAFRSSVAAAAETIMPPSMLKDYASALSSIQKTLRFGQTELDIQEQKARIEKLRREALEDDSSDSEITVILEGGLDEYAE